MAEPTTYIYDIRSHVFQFGAVLIDRDHGDGFVEVEPGGPSFGEKMGTDGTFTRTATNNRAKKFKLHLAKKSPFNAVLSALHTLDTTATNGAGVAPIMVKDLDGVKIHAGESAWISGWPPDNIDAEAAEVVWEFTCGVGKSIF